MLTRSLSDLNQVAGTTVNFSNSGDHNESIVERGGYPSNLVGNSGDEDRSGQAPEVLTALTDLSTDEIDAGFESLRRHGLVVSRTFMTGISPEWAP